MTVDASYAKAFKDLKNPYTGEKIKVMMTVTKNGKTFFSAPETYTPNDPLPTAREAVDAWSRVDGIAGLRVPPFKCAFTGKPLSPHTTDDGHSMAGGINLKVLRSREEFLYFVTMRDGVSQYPAPTTEVKHVERVEEAAPAALGHEVEVTEEAMQQAAEVVKQSNLQTQSRTVSMSVAKPKSAARSPKSQKRKPARQTGGAAK